MARGCASQSNTRALYEYDAPAVRQREYSARETYWSPHPHEIKSKRVLFRDVKETPFPVRQKAKEKCRGVRGAHSLTPCSLFLFFFGKKNDYDTPERRRYSRRRHLAREDNALCERIMHPFPVVGSKTRSTRGSSRDGRGVTASHGHGTSRPAKKRGDEVTRMRSLVTDDGGRDVEEDEGVEAEETSEEEREEEVLRGCDRSVLSSGYVMTPPPSEPPASRAGPRRFPGESLPPPQSAPAFFFLFVFFFSCLEDGTRQQVGNKTIDSFFFFFFFLGLGPSAAATSLSSN